MRAFRRGWERFWFAPVDGTGHALVRILYALTGLLLWTETVPTLARFYGATGEFPAAAARLWARSTVARLVLPDFLGSAGAAALLMSVLLVALVALLVGYRTRTAAIVSWALVTWLQLRNPTFLNGGDDVLRLIGFYLAAGYLAIPAGARALSLDRRMAAAEGRARPAVVPAWTVRVIQIQLCLVYFVAGFWKTLGTAWWDGSVVYYALGNPALTRFGFPDLPAFQPLFALASSAVVLWELAFPLLVAFRRTRLAALGFGVLVHGVILVGMNIGIFSFAMLAAYPAFLDGGRLRSRLSGLTWPRARLRRAIPADGPGA